MDTDVSEGYCLHLQSEDRVNHLAHNGHLKSVEQVIIETLKMITKIVTMFTRLLLLS
jgi:hypothetical protein